MQEFGCLDCALEFSSADMLKSHCSILGHRFGCGFCNRKFPHIAALYQHIQYSPAHKRGSNSTESEFRSSDSEAEILNNDFLSLGQGQKRVFKCIFCQVSFTSPSAVAMHIESGRHKITRHQVTVAVHKLAIVPNISVDRRLGGPIDPPSAIVTYSATHMAFNGTAYECHVCHSMHATLSRLNAHLNSPAHDADEFKCPKCKVEFKLVSGLIQHIESGTCALAKFSQIQKHFEDLTDQFSKVLKF